MSAAADHYHRLGICQSAFMLGGTLQGHLPKIMLKKKRKGTRFMLEVAANCCLSLLRMTGNLCYALQNYVKGKKGDQFYI